MHFSTTPALRIGSTSPAANLFIIGVVAPAALAVAAPDVVQPGMIAVVSVHCGWASPPCGLKLITLYASPLWLASVSDL